MVKPYTPEALERIGISVHKSPSGKTWIATEKCCYPGGGQHRPGVVLCEEDGKYRACRAGIADTFYSVPAHCRIKDKYTAGFIMMKSKSGLSTDPDWEYVFIAYNKEGDRGENHKT